MSPGVNLPPVLCITGTDTGVGKTIATAALAAALSAVGRTVAVYKPTQAGLEDGDGDIDVVRRLGGIESVHEGIRLQYPMAPVAAAAREGVALVPLSVHRATVAALATHHDITLVEGAGGLLVHLDDNGGTLADLAVPDSAYIVVCRATLGTLNHTELTLEALRNRGCVVAGLIIGTWPARPSETELSNRDYFSRCGVPLLGAIPSGAGDLSPAEFRAATAESIVL
ncbi:dethiobiotin synthase [Conexibacter sp. DBS9H8]|uniref:dethiobiotin synthase n=1 Tax=Conexibacter sp. DBS9H8 TaxID=2937801 RepID=UPI00200E75CC|nr:dethiobiotin synthase [Conexibacter sp. DBS9H8]